MGGHLSLDAFASNSRSSRSKKPCNGDERPPRTIRDLPPKVRNLILEKLSWSDILSCRLVCQQWYVDVSDCAFMFGTIDETGVGAGTGTGSPGESDREDKKAKEKVDDTNNNNNNTTDINNNSVESIDENNNSDSKTSENPNEKIQAPVIFFSSNQHQHQKEEFGINTGTDVVKLTAPPLNCHCLRILNLTSQTFDFMSIFPHPENIQILIITGPISLDHLLTLFRNLPCISKLKLCTNQVLSLRKNDTWNSKESNLIPKTCSVGDFVQSQFLTKISIRGPVGDSVEKLMCSSRKLFRRFIQSKFPALKSFELLDVECNQYDEPSLTILVLVFIGNHRKTLDDLTVKMTSVPHVDLVTGQKCQLLSVGLPEELLIPDEAIEETQLRKLSIRPLQTGIGGVHWLNLMQEQSNLREIHGGFLAAPFSLYRSVINRNFKTLTLIHLSSLSLREPSDPDPTHRRPLRLSSLMKCMNLTTLILERFEKDPPVNEINSTSELVNLTTLPHSLQRVEIHRFRLNQEDIFEFVTALPRLKDLRLYECGRSGIYGVNGALLMALIRLRLQLEVGVGGGLGNALKLEYLSVKPLNVSSGQDYDKIEKCFEIMGKSESFEETFLKERAIHWHLRANNDNNGNDSENKGNATGQNYWDSYGVSHLKKSHCNCNQRSRSHGFNPNNNNCSLNLGYGSSVFSKMGNSFAGGKFNAFVSSIRDVFK